MFHLIGSCCWYNREFRKLRRQLQGKRHIKIELCVKLSLLRLFHVDHVVQNRRSALSLAGHRWFSSKGKEWKIYSCELALSSEPQIWKFHVVVWQTASKQCTKKRAARAARFFFHSLNHSNQWFVALSLTLPSSNLKLPQWGLLERALTSTWSVHTLTKIMLQKRNYHLCWNQYGTQFTVQSKIVRSKKLCPSFFFLKNSKKNENPWC